MRMHHVVRPDHAGERAPHDRIGEHAVQFRDRGQQVVAGVQFCLGADQRVEALEDAAVETFRQLRLQQQVAVRDEALHLRVGQQDGGGHGWVPPGVLVADTLRGP